MSMTKLNGLLMKSIGGFYYVRCDGKEYECKARGSFRKSGNSPVVGDKVVISVPDAALANIDTLVIVCSTVDPEPNFTVIDKMTAAAVNNNMIPAIVVSKNDLKSGERIAKIYRNSEFPVFLCSPDDTENVNKLKDFLKGKVSAFTGNSGVGKSTLINRIFPELELQTGQISRKLGRGKHTTRVVELFEIDGCFVADTPGFSTVDLQRYEMIDKTHLQYCFPEFEKYLGECQFTSCSHTCEKGCRILQAVSDGEIEPSRHKSYVAMYNEVKDIKEWELR